MSKVLLGLLLAGASGGAWFAARPQAAASTPHASLRVPAAGTAAKRPVLVELYQSQGCSSCPPANANVNAIADRPDVVALSFGVTYWDQLGWKDSFAKPQFTDRQWEYAKAKKRGNVATPQIWVNGQTTIVGNDAGQLSGEIARARSDGPTLDIAHQSIAIGAGDGGKGDATIWLAHYDPAVRQVPIRAGENGGRTLPHRDVVTSLDAIGHWSGRAVRLPLPVAPKGLHSAVFLQAGTGGVVLAAAKS